MVKAGFRAAAVAVMLATMSAGATAAPNVPLDFLPALKGGYFPLQSRAAGHLYHIYMRLPDGYEADKQKRYPIVYLLDGD